MKAYWPRMVQRDFAPRGYVRQLLKDLEMVSAWAGKPAIQDTGPGKRARGLPRAEEAGTQRARHLGGGEAISEGVTPPRLSAFILLALANLLWSGNWIAGRALRDAFDPITLNFWRWAIATLVLAPFALPALRGQGALLRRHAGILLILALTGVALFQSLVYLGLRSTTAVNAVLINSSIPLFILLCSWVIERERASPRQIAGMLVSLAGILVILSRGDPGALLELELHAGDGWILLAMPVWGIYSVLLKRRPPSSAACAFLFVISLAGC